MKRYNVTAIAPNRTLASGIDSGAGSLDLDSAPAGAPATPFQIAVWEEQGDGSYSRSEMEVMEVTAISGATLTIGDRGMEGTSARSFSSGALVTIGLWTPSQLNFALGEGENVLWHGAKGDGSTDDTAAIQSAVDAVQGGGKVIVPPGLYIISDNIELYDNVTLEGFGKSSQLRKADSTGEFTLLTNADRENGNEGITVRSILLDGNRENNSGKYSCAHFTEIRDSEFSNMWARGAQRATSGAQPFPGAGEGLEFVRCSNISVIGGHFFENAYDGVKWRNCRSSTLTGATGYNNGRALTQLTAESGQLPETASERITVTGCSSFNDDPNPSPSNNSGIALHSAVDCVVTGNVIKGTGYGIDLLEQSDRNIISNNYIAPDLSINNSKVAIRLWEWDGLGNDRNIIQNNIIRPTSDGDHFVEIEGNDNVLSQNTYLDGGSSGMDVIIKGSNNRIELERWDGSDNYTDQGTGNSIGRFSDLLSGGGDGQVQVVSHGSNADVARPSVDNVLWEGTVEPNNAQPGDILFIDLS